MAIFNTPLGMNVISSPLIESPFVIDNHLGVANPPYEYMDLVTETGVFILTETLEFITTG